MILGDYTVGAALALLGTLVTVFGGIHARQQGVARREARDDTGQILQSVDRLRDQQSALWANQLVLERRVAALEALAGVVERPLPDNPERRSRHVQAE